MELVPVIFKLERKSLLPILTVTGMCKNMLGIDGFLLGKAVEIINLSQNQLKGKLLELMGHEDDICIQDGMAAVRFYILFESDEQCKQAITRIRKVLG